MNQPKPFFQNKIVFTLLSMGLVGGLIGLIIGVANGSGFLGLLIGILLTVFISIAGISTNQNENTMRYIICAFFYWQLFIFLGVVGIILGLLVGWFLGWYLYWLYLGRYRSKTPTLSLLARSCGTMFLELSVGLSSFPHYANSSRYASFI